ncbi:MAG: phosphotransferase [Trueperaceae bacterium]
MCSRDHLERTLREWEGCRIVRRLAEGHRNTVFLVERDGERLVAKSSRRSREAIAWLEPVQELAREVGFVVPRFVPSNEGELLVGGVTVETWIEGTPFVRAELRRLRSRLHAFHRLTRRWAQRPGFASSVELLAVERGGDVDLSLMPPGLLEAVRAAWQEFSAEEPSVVHGDPGLSNLLVMPDSRLALLDWDEARVDVSLLDDAALPFEGSRATGPRRTRAIRALLAWEVAASWRVEPDHARRLAGDFMSGRAVWRN